MTAWSSRLIRAVPAALAALLVLVLFWAIGWQLIRIQLRLWKNGAIAARIVESLRARFPEANFRGVAAYDREVVYISVVDGLDPEARPAVEQWLRKLKAEQRIAPAIWLRFPESTGEEMDTIEIDQDGNLANPNAAADRCSRMLLWDRDSQWQPRHYPI